MFMTETIKHRSP